jgi:hypothetical protein
MNVSRRGILCTVALVFCAMSAMPAAVLAQSAASPKVLNRDEASKILPSSVFFRGQSAAIQGRNSAGLRLADDKLVLVTMVDTSGYASSLQQKYQAYLLTEVPLRLGDQTLHPGAYGFGFIEGGKMVVMDIGGNEILHATTTRDEKLARPTPLQIISEAGQGIRLYLGRSYVPISVAGK